MSLYEDLAKALADAKEGNYLWVFDRDASKIVDGKYVGRGEYKLCKIERVTRQSFHLVYNGYPLAFERETGIQRAVKAGYPKNIYGMEERADREWRENNLYKLARHIEYFKGDLSVLIEVAKLTGYLVEEEEKP